VAYINRLEDMYLEMLTPEFIAERRKEIRHVKGRGHARATVKKQFTSQLIS
jgi:hypothetical protein